jgi:type II secretory pathway pseudopilin PulG
MMTVAVLVTLLVAALLAAAFIQSLVGHLRQVRIAEQQQQSFWLAESAMQRALQRLATDADYRGETWNVSPELLGGPDAGLAVIRIEPTTSPQPGTWIRVEARYPDDPVHRITHNRERFVPSAS